MRHYLRNYYWVPVEGSDVGPAVSLCGLEFEFTYTFPDEPDDEVSPELCDICVLLHFANPEQTESWYRYKEDG